MRITALGSAAFATNIVCASATIGAVVAATTATSTVAMVALGFVATTFAGLSAGAASAYFDPTSTSVNGYFENVKKHSAYLVVGMFQFTAQTMAQAFVQGLAEGVKTRVANAFSGSQDSRRSV